MLKRLGGRVEVDVKGRPAVELQVGDEGCAEGGLAVSDTMLPHSNTRTRPTLPAPAGPITMTPNLLMAAKCWRRSCLAY